MLSTSKDGESASDPVTNKHFDDVVQSSVNTVVSANTVHDEVESAEISELKRSVESTVLERVGDDPIDSQASELSPARGNIGMLIEGSEVIVTVTLTLIYQNLGEVLQRIVTILHQRILITQFAK